MVVGQSHEVGLKRWTLDGAAAAKSLLRLMRQINKLGSPRLS
jgi:hypothetical protein